MHVEVVQPCACQEVAFYRTSIALLETAAETKLWRQRLPMRFDMPSQFPSQSLKTVPPVHVCLQYSRDFTLVRRPVTAEVKL